MTRRAAHYQITVYKNLHHAFLFEALAGIIALLTVAVVGINGVAVLAVLVLRPFVLERMKAPVHEQPWRLYSFAVVSASLLTAVSLAFTAWFLDLPWYESAGVRYLSLLAIPWFILNHGVTGFFLSYPDKRDSTQ